MADGNGDKTVVVERGGSGATVIIAIVLLIAVAIGGLYLYNRSAHENAASDAVSKAAGSVGDAAQKAGDAVTPSGH